MKNKIVIALLVFIILSNIDVKAQNVRLTDITIGAKNSNNLEALGAELDPHFFSQNITRNDGSKVSDWQYVEKRIKAMNLKKIRVMVQPQWYEPVNDNDDPNKSNLESFTFETLEMQSLYRVLDMAQGQDMDVCIVLWGCPVYVKLLDEKYAHVKTCFMADPTKKNVWITGPTNYDEWAENFSVLVKYLIEVKGYSCVKEITPMNEPDGGPLLTSEEYIKMAKVLDARFTKDGIRDKVRFNLSDNTDTRVFYLEECAKNLKKEADIFNSHTYIFGYETPNNIISEWERKNVEISAKAGKKHLVGEFGSNQCEGASRQRDIDSYERGVLIARQVLNFLNAGACGVSYWGLIDQYYGRDQSYQEMQQLGLWRYIKDAYKPTPDVYKNIRTDYEVRPQYYSYSLLSRFLTPDSEIYPLYLDKDFAIGTAFRDRAGVWTYVFANGSEQEEQFNVVNPEINANFDLFVYDKEALPENDNMIEAKETVSTIESRLHIVLKPQTVTLYRQKQQ